MELVLQKPSLSQLKTRILVVPVLASELEKAEKQSGKRSGSKSAPKDGPGLGEVDAFVGGTLMKRLHDCGYKGKPGQSSLLQFPNSDSLQAVFVYGWNLDSKSTFDKVGAYRKLGTACYEVAKRLDTTEVVLSSAHLDLKSTEHMLALLEGVKLSGYSFTQFKQKSDKKDKSEFAGVEKLTVLSSRALASKAADLAEIYTRATAFARDLINTPPNVCTPTFLMKHCKELAKKGGLKIDIFDEKALKKMGAGAILAVAAGSEEPPYIIRMSYKPKKASKKKIAIVGKGVTFDSGGLSIKPGSGMETMKCDMSGAAAVMATMSVISELKPNCEVWAYIPTTENMINGRATRPGDVVTALSGKTIEILNTDAEGRLILADAVTIAERDNCSVIVDLATLTGACMVALGSEYAGLFANDDKLAEKLMAAGDVAGEHFWRLPLAPEYREWIKSPVAEIKNLGRPFGGAITGALFIGEFISKAQWAHLDIAGTAFADGDSGFIKRGGVGFGVRTLLNWLRLL